MSFGVPLLPLGAAPARYVARPPGHGSPCRLHLLTSTSHDLSSGPHPRTPRSKSTYDHRERGGLFKNCGGLFKILGGLFKTKRFPRNRGNLFVLYRVCLKVYRVCLKLNRPCILLNRRLFSVKTGSKLKTEVTYTVQG